VLSKNENDTHTPKLKLATTCKSVYYKWKHHLLTAKAGTFEVRRKTNKPMALMALLITQGTQKRVGYTKATL